MGPKYFLGHWGPAPLGWGVDDPYKHAPCPSFTYVTVPNLIVVGHAERAYYRKCAGKIGPLASHFSRSLKVIETDTDRSATCDRRSLFMQQQLKYTQMTAGDKLNE